MVQRYDLKEDWVTGHIDLEEDADGDWVGYEDYAKLEAELQKYKDQFPDYVECVNCGSVTHVEGVEGAIGQSCCRKEDAQECDHNWIIAPGLFIAEGHKDNVPGSLFCCECGAREWDDKDYKPKNDTQKCKHEWGYYYPHGEEYRHCAKCGVIAE